MTILPLNQWITENQFVVLLYLVGVGIIFIVTYTILKLIGLKDERTS
jgi:hypothetical protein